MVSASQEVHPGAMSIPESAIPPRLLYVRYLYEKGVHQSKESPPWHTASVSTFHDAVEMLLALALEHNNVPNERVPFLQYWAKFQEKSGRALPHLGAMDRLNYLRVQLKHHGIPPRDEEVDTARFSAGAFLSEATRVIFPQLRLENVSIVSLVKYPRTRQHLELAQSAMTDGSVGTAIGELALGFDELLDEYEEQKQDAHGRSPFFFGRLPSYRHPSAREVERLTGAAPRRDAAADYVQQRAYESFARDVGERFEAIDAALKLVSLGLDYRRYTRFRYLVPKALRVNNQSMLAEVTRADPPTLEECAECLQFVIDSALHLQA